MYLNYFKPERAALAQLGLSPALVDLIREDRLLEEVEKAYKRYAALCAALDAWEAQNPVAAKLAPWFEGREKWKADGRPLPEWYELLRMFQSPHVPIRKKDIEQQLLAQHAENQRRYRAKKKAGMMQVPSQTSRSLPIPPSP